MAFGFGDESRVQLLLQKRFVETFNCGAQIHFAVLAEAGVNLTGASHAHAIAIGAKIMRERGNEADATPRIIMLRRRAVEISRRTGGSMAAGG